MKQLIQTSKQGMARLWLIVKHSMVALTPLRAAEDLLLLLVILQLAILSINGLNGSNPIVGLRLENQVIGHLNSENFKEKTNTITEPRKYQNSRQSGRRNQRNNIAATGRQCR